MQSMGTQKPLGINCNILNKYIPSKSPSKRSRARKTLDRTDVRTKGRRYKPNVQDLEFLDTMDTDFDEPNIIQLPSQNYNPQANRYCDLSFHSLPPEYDELQQNYSYQSNKMDYSSPTMAMDCVINNPGLPQLPPRPDYNTSMLVFNASAVNSSSHSPLPVVSGFPSYFNPRLAKNMPHNEKVERWMENLPIYFEESGQMAHTDCFSVTEDTEYWEENEFDDGLEQPIVLTNSVEIVFLQQRRITTLIKKLYNMNN